MATLDVTISVFDGVVQDGTWDVRRDFERAKRVFARVPITFRMMVFTLDAAQSRAILGANGRFDIGGPAKTFDHTFPWSGNQVTVGDPGGQYTREVWDAIRDWTNFGGMRVFYVPSIMDATPSSGGHVSVGDVGGKTLSAHGSFDPIIFVDHKENLLLLKTTGFTRGVLEHEIGHAFGLPHKVGSPKNLMYETADGGSGTDLAPAQIQHIQNSTLLQNRPVTPGHPSII